MTSLPVVYDGGSTLVVEPDSGNMIPLAEASDRALAHAAQKLAQHDRDVYGYRRAVAAELRARHGVGATSAGGFSFKIAESENWPIGTTEHVLRDLARHGQITAGDVDRCLPLKPKPDSRQLRALLSRLLVSDPEAAKVLAAACSVSPPSVRDVHEASVDSEAAA